jgi:hypothetical protein
MATIINKYFRKSLPIYSTYHEDNIYILTLESQINNTTVIFDVEVPKIIFDALEELDIIKL